MERKRLSPGVALRPVEDVVDQHFTTVTAAICETLHLLPLPFLRPETAHLVEARAARAMRAVILEDALRLGEPPMTRRLLASLTAFRGELQSLGGLGELTHSSTRSRCALEARALEALASRSGHPADAVVEERSRRSYRLFEWDRVIGELQLTAAL